MNLLAFFVAVVAISVASGQTDAPTAAPATDAPTVAPATDAPTAAPATDAQTAAPGTDAPTAAPGTDGPTAAPGTDGPTAAPGTDGPTEAPKTTPDPALKQTIVLGIQNGNYDQAKFLVAFVQVYNKHCAVDANNNCTIDNINATHVIFVSEPIARAAEDLEFIVQKDGKTAPWEDIKTVIDENKVEFAQASGLEVTAKPKEFQLPPIDVNNLLPRGTVEAKFGIWLYPSHSTSAITPQQAVDYWNAVGDQDAENVILDQLFNQLVVPNKLEATLNLNYLNDTIDLIKIERTRFQGALFMQFSVNDPDLSADPREYLNFQVPELINNYTRFLSENRIIDLTSVNFPVNATVIAFDVTMMTQLPQYLGDRCDFFGFCGEILNAECVDDGTNRNQHRCSCRGPYVAADVDKCYKRISSLHDLTCKTCERNEGVCYDIDGDNKRDGCACTNTRSGDNCEVNYVAVTCTNKDMTICVTPFDLVGNYRDPWFQENEFSKQLEAANNWTTPESYIHLKNKQHHPYCEFQKALLGAPAGCPTGSYWLKLSTLNSDLSQCGIQKLREVGKLFFITTVQVNTPVPIHDVNFLAKCAFQERFEKGTENGLEINVPILGSTGSYESAEVKMTILDRDNAVLEPTHQLYENDEIKIRFDMIDKKNLFRAIIVDYCSASTSSVIGYPGATVQRLISDRCPAPGQKFVDNSNTFRPEAGSITSLITRPSGIRAFRLGSNSALYFHCTVRVCQQPDDCKPADCNGSPSFGRKKRASGNDAGMVELYRKMSVLREGETPGVSAGQEQTVSSGNQMIMIVALVAGGCVFLMLAVLAVGGIMFHKVKVEAARTEGKLAYTNEAMAKSEPSLAPHTTV